MSIVKTQHFSLTNLGKCVWYDETNEDKEEDPNPFQRKLSFIWYFVLYSALLVTILILCNFNELFDFNLYNVKIYDVVHFKPIKWAELPLVQEKFYLNVIIGITLGVGVLSIVLDFIYSCFGCGVFIFQKGILIVLLPVTFKLETFIDIKLHLSAFYPFHLGFKKN